jgi:hypothetical protein
MFFGRDQELNEIAAFLRGGQSVSLVGPRKIGKSSLLLHLMRPEIRGALGVGDENLLVYLDGEAFSAERQNRIFSHFCTEMTAALDSRGADPEPALAAAIANPTRINFEGAVRRLNQRGVRVVLILDQFEGLSVNPHLDMKFFNGLRSAAGRYQLVFLTASARPLSELTHSDRPNEILSSPFFNIFALLSVGLLKEEESRALIRAPLQAVGIPVTPALEDFVYELVGGHPLGLQAACLHAQKGPNDFAEIERRALQELQLHLDVCWHGLNAVEQDSLLHLADAVLRESGDTTVRLALRDLVQKCLLDRDQGGLYRYPSRAWAEFIAAQAAE